VNARSMRFAVVAPFAAVALAGAGNPVFAAEQVLVMLDYDVRAGSTRCPGAADFRRVVGHQLGYDPFRENADKQMVVRVDATARGLEGRVEWRSVKGDLEGERRVSSPERDCADLVRSMAFAVAVQLRLLARISPPLATTPAPPPSPRVADPAVEPNSPPPPPAAGSTITRRPETRPLQPPPPTLPVGHHSLAIGLGLGPSAGFGLVPGPVVAGTLFAELGLDWLSVELGAKGVWPPTLRQADGSGFTHYYFAFTGAGCGHVDRWSACILGDLGRTLVRGSGVDAPRSSFGTAALAGLRVAMTQNLADGLFVRTHADVLGVLTPWTVTLNHAEVWRMPRLAAAVGIDLALRFR